MVYGDGGCETKVGLQVVEYAILTGLVVAAALVSLGILGVWTSGRLVLSVRTWVQAPMRAQVRARKKGSEHDKET